jgi:hypothetical protein
MKSKARSRGASIWVVSEIGPIAAAILSPRLEIALFAPLWQVLNLSLGHIGVASNIEDVVIREQATEVHKAGVAAGAGSFICLDCDYPVSLTPGDQIPACPDCGGSRFRRASIFEQPTTGNVAIRRRVVEPAEWLEGVRSMITRPGKYLAMFVDGRKRVIKLEAGWSRIGRSGSADIRLDDPTVSRRHAVVVQTPEGELRVLDDRSMNGVYVNEEQVDWSPIVDGDTLQVGRYTLHVIETAGAPAPDQA